MPPITEMSATSGYAQLNDITAHVVRLREEVQIANGARFTYLPLALIVFCACVIALGHLDPGFHPSGGIYVWIALVLAFKAIGDVFVAHQQMKLALALLGQRALTERLRDCNANSIGNIRNIPGPTTIVSRDSPPT